MATMYVVKKNSESAGEMGPLAGSQVRELVQSGELTASDSIRNVNSQNWVRIDSVPQLASELGKPKSSPVQDVDLEHPQQVQLNPDQAKGAKSDLLQEGSSPIFTHAETLKTSVAEDGVLPPSSGFSARMNKTKLGVVMVVVFCITWWLVAGEAWRAANRIEQQSASARGRDALGLIADANSGNRGPNGQHISTYKQTWVPGLSAASDEHFQTMALWGIVAGVVASRLAWSKLTAKP